MKNAFKIPFLALAIAISIAGCKGNKSGSSADSSAKVDSSSSVKTSSDTSVKVDTTKGTDTSSGKVDTVAKTVTKHTEVKKTVAKKD